MILSHLICLSALSTLTFAASFNVGNEILKGPSPNVQVNIGNYQYENIYFNFTTRANPVDKSIANNQYIDEIVLSFKVEKENNSTNILPTTFFLSYTYADENYNIFNENDLIYENTNFQPDIVSFDLNNYSSYQLSVDFSFMINHDYVYLYYTISVYYGNFSSSYNATALYDINNLSGNYQQDFNADLDEYYLMDHYVIVNPTFKTYTEGYNEGYAIGKSDGDSEGYARGYNIGVEAGKLQGGNFNFLGLFGAIADTPVIMIRSLFSFDIFGVSALTIFMSLLTAIIVLYFIRKFI